jgi:hypothetical protein
MLTGQYTHFFFSFFVVMPTFLHAGAMAQAAQSGLRAVQQALPWYTNWWQSLSCLSGGIIFLNSCSIFTGSVSFTRPILFESLMQCVSTTTAGL